MSHKHEPAHIRREKFRNIIRRFMVLKKPVNISRVAREAGVSTSLIHNYYPDIAYEIRRIADNTPRRSRATLREKLKDANAKNKVLQNEIQQLQLRISKLATINEMLNYNLKNKLSRNK
ncbi:TPA: hypothetical protein ACGB3K_002326 [Klebsiella aerogenes]|uniref:hypothetical protein n=1 Tax=Enterobacteriaceae TaxID=543 RepID=UPI000B6C51C0|nr:MULTISPECIES: hypothetical protein [Enterobacteriaceae]MBH3103030.1 hypothetical protein [Serratia marcescens]EIX9530270.1 hypothetical protein [Klebsiella pneumoniae]OVI98773.1 hypothetical protein B8032_21735 [Klebsiella pneumoniae]HBS9219343.1 hypothetical protein [Klebsiella pneumoniae]HBS9700074.1 hypothetical protein [Klebsiella pneumoniae]